VGVGVGGGGGAGVVGDEDGDGSVVNRVMVEILRGADGAPIRMTSVFV
jgi:hypothetical protein